MRPGVHYRRPPDVGLAPGAGVDVPADDQPRCQAFDRCAHRPAAQSAAPACFVPRTPGRRVRDQDAAGRALRQQRFRLLLAEIPAPGAKGRNRDAAAQPEKMQPCEAGPAAVQHHGGIPGPAGLPQLLFGFVVARHQHDRFVDRLQPFQRRFQVEAQVADVPGDHDHIRRCSPVHDPVAGSQAAVQVAVQVEFPFHGVSVAQADFRAVRLKKADSGGKKRNFSV